MSSLKPILERLRQPSGSVLWQLVRYALTGGLAFCVDFGLLWLVTDVVGLHYLVGAAIGYAAGIAITYLLSIKWIFDYRRMSSQAAELGIFVLIGLVGLLLTQGLMYLLTDIWLGRDLYLVSKIITTVVVSLFNFGMKKWLLFRR